MALADGCSNGLDYFFPAWYYTQRGERSSIDHHIIIDKNFVLGIMTVNHVDIDVQFTFELRRRTDSVEP